MGNSLDDEPRGAKDCMLAISNIIKSGYEVKAIFLGEGNLVDDLKVLAEQLKIVDCVEFTTAHFDEIQNYYKISEIVVVPSRFSEGTSLSAIEALASNCFVVSSCVGGLQNFPLFPPYGMMIEPTPDRITFGIKNYLDNREEYLNENKSNNSILSRFEITRWKKEVISLINSI
jgi:glycosyltransferase involved in cell wall biosynthesis